MAITLSESPESRDLTERHPASSRGVFGNPCPEGEKRVCYYPEVPRAVLGHCVAKRKAFEMVTLDSNSRTTVAAVVAMVIWCSE